VRLSLTLRRSDCAGLHSVDVVLNILARQRDPGKPATILTPDALTLRARK